MDDGLQWKQRHQSGSHFKSLHEDISNEAREKQEE